MKVVPGHRSSPRATSRRSCRRTCATRRTCSRCSAALLAKYHVNDPVTFFSNVGLLGRAARSRTRPPAAIQPPYYIVAKDLAHNDNSASFQLTSAMNRFRRDFLAAYISASSDPDDVRQDHGADHSGPGQRARSWRINAISTDTAVSQDLGVIGRDNQNRIRWGNLLTLPVAQGGLLYVAAGLRLAGSQRRGIVVPAADPRGDDVQRQGRLRPDGARCAHRVVRAGCRRHRDRSGAGRTGERTTARRRHRRSDGQPAAPQPPRQGQAPEVPTPIAVPAGCRRSDCSCRRRKAAALQEVQSAMGEPRQAQQSGDFAEYGAGAAAPRRCDEEVQHHQVIAPGRRPSLNRHRVIPRWCWRTLGADLVAEEVKDEDTLGALRRYGCNISRASFTPCPARRRPAAVDRQRYAPAPTR